MSRKGRIGEMGGCIQRVQTAWLLSGLSLEKHMVGTERVISVLIGIIIIMDLEMSHLTL